MPTNDILLSQVVAVNKSKSSLVKALPIFQSVSQALSSPMQDRSRATIEKPMAVDALCYTGTSESSEF